MLVLEQFQKDIFDVLLYDGSKTLGGIKDRRISWLFTKSIILEKHQTFPSCVHAICFFANESAIKLHKKQIFMFLYSMYNSCRKTLGKSEKAVYKIFNGMKICQD